MSLRLYATNEQTKKVILRKKFATFSCLSYFIFVNEEIILVVWLVVILFNLVELILIVN